ncbi:MAG: type I restriction enzyme HsdR N-terminal domain-containing protein [Cytophagales bacterium]|nr:type I restriction enzyme HsdR N-terminal domain-containing protein [Cytophagales bacterium]
MKNLIFPPFEYRTKEVDGKMVIFDIIRKKYILLTPEEIVRQHVVHFLINHLKYPRSLIAVEDGIKVSRMTKRSDIVVFNRDGSVFLAIECKSSKVNLTQKSMDQLSVYNQYYQANYLALTNGMVLYICKIDYDTRNIEFINEFPPYN